MKEKEYTRNGDNMNTGFFVLKDEFKQLKIDKETMTAYMTMKETQLSKIFTAFEYENILSRIKNFYTAIETKENMIILSHELSDKQSIIHILQHEIVVEDKDSNMLLPLLKRLYRNSFLIDLKD